MDQRTARLLENSNRVGVNFLITDLGAILTLLNVADVAADEGTRLRNRTQARDAYGAVLRYLPRVSPSLEERLEIEEKLVAIHSRLQRAGIPVDTAWLPAVNPEFPS